MSLTNEDNGSLKEILPHEWLTARDINVQQISKWIYFPIQNQLFVQVK